MCLIRRGDPHGNESNGRPGVLTSVRPPDMRVLTVSAGSSSLKLRELGEDGSAAVAGAAAGVTGIAAVGHRVVHGGVGFREPVLIDDVVTDRIEALAPLAPLHQPRALAGIAAARGALPGLPHVPASTPRFTPASLRRPPRTRSQGVDGTVGRAPVRISRPFTRLCRAASHRGAGRGSGRSAPRDPPPRRRCFAGGRPRRRLGRHDNGLHAARGTRHGYTERRRRSGSADSGHRTSWGSRQATFQTCSHADRGCSG